MNSRVRGQRHFIMACQPALHVCLEWHQKYNIVASQLGCHRYRTGDWSGKVFGLATSIFWAFCDIMFEWYSPVMGIYRGHKFFSSILNACLWVAVCVSVNAVPANAVPALKGLILLYCIDITHLVVVPFGSVDLLSSLYSLAHPDHSSSVNSFYSRNFWIFSPAKLPDSNLQ